MEEKRVESRSRIKSSGFFVQDGLLSEVKLRDAHTHGVGAYASREFKPGQQGILCARLPHSDEVSEIPSEVCWCMQDPMAEDAIYPYRVGLRLLVA